MDEKIAILAVMALFAGMFQPPANQIGVQLGPHVSHTGDADRGSRTWQPAFGEALPGGSRLA